jgi:hypothetical protein
MSDRSALDGNPASQSTTDARDEASPDAARQPIRCPHCHNPIYLGHPRHPSGRQRRCLAAATQLLATAMTAAVKMHRQFDRQGRTHALHSSLLPPSRSPASVFRPNG